MTFKVDYTAIKKKLENYIDSDVRIKNAVDSMAQKVFLRAHGALLREFNTHSITEELKAGPTASNTSNTLGGNGNLSSFLGFFSNQNPTEELHSLLNKISMKKVTRRGNVVYFRIDLPEKQEIMAATRMNWGSGTSWAYAVENGEFNGDEALSHFVFKTWAGSRSKQGFQVAGEYTSDNFSPKPYITEILNNFRSRINQTKV